jgi:hypothetical protein
MLRSLRSRRADKARSAVLTSCPQGSFSLEAVLTVHAGALVHVGLGDVGAPARGYPLLDALADEAAHQEGATLDAPVGLGVPSDPLFVGQRTLFREVCWPPHSTPAGGMSSDRPLPRLAGLEAGSLIRTTDCRMIGTQRLYLWEDVLDVA